MLTVSALFSIKTQIAMSSLPPRDTVIPTKGASVSCTQPLFAHSECESAPWRHLSPHANLSTVKHECPMSIAAISASVKAHIDAESASVSCTQPLFARV